MKKYLCFLILPIITVIAQIGYMDTFQRFLSYMLYVVVESGVSFCVYILIEKLLKKYTKTSSMAIITSIMIFLDQGIKLLIWKFNVKFHIIGELLQIRISKNINQMAMLNFLKIELSTPIVLTLKILCLALLIFVYIKFKNNYPQIKPIMILLLSAQLANILDSALWGYTLDYVYFYKLTTYDLKDFYIDSSVAIGFYTYIKIAIQKESEKKKLQKS